MPEFLHAAIDEYLASQHFLFLDPPLKEHALSTLSSFTDACTQAGISSPAAVSLDRLETALATSIARCAIGVEGQRRAPEVIRAFLGYLDSSGHQPGAAVWARWVDDLAPRIVARLRDDGSLRGRTQVNRAAPVSRNDPCPCGSGKKFKKCCMALLG